MKLKNLSLALGLLLALPSIGLISCGKKKEGYTVKVSVTDIGTAKVYRDILENNSKSKIDSNANGAKITSVKVTYIDEKGKKVEDKSGELDVNKEFTKTYQVAAGKTIIVTATAEGSPAADLTKGKTVDDIEALRAKAKALTEALKKKGKADELANELIKAVEMAKKDAEGKPSEITLPTLNITIEKGGETIAAQSVTASKSNVTPEELTKAGKKTTVSATATAVAFEVK